MSWFSDIPDQVTITGRHRLLPAGQAMADTDPGETDPWHERPPDDWGATAVLLMARLQLDQMVEILQQAPFGVDTDWRTGLHRAAEDRRALGLDADDLDRVSEGIRLREALQASTEVRHGLALDGSITITTGPDIPASPALGLRGSYAREMNDDPLQVFRCAVDCTQAAARLHAALDAARFGGGASSADHR